jgi:hypothetical protein
MSDVDDEIAEILGTETATDQPATTSDGGGGGSTAVSDESGRPNILTVGIILVGLGVLLLLQRLVPGVGLWAFMGLLLGIALLALWCTNRRPVLLTFGLVFVALGVPSVLGAMGFISGPGWGLLFLGLVLLGLAVTKPGGDFGLSFWVGVILVLVGGSQVFFGGILEWIVPIAVIGLGILMLARAMSSRSAT